MICVVNSILLVTISAYLQRIVPITITWASLFLLIGRLGDYLYRETDNRVLAAARPVARHAAGRPAVLRHVPREIDARAGLVGAGDPDAVRRALVALACRWLDRVRARAYVASRVRR